MTRDEKVMQSLKDVKKIVDHLIENPHLAHSTKWDLILLAMRQLRSAAIDTEIEKAIHHIKHGPKGIATRKVTGAFNKERSK